MGTCVGAAATPVVVDVARRAIVGIWPAAEGTWTDKLLLDGETVGTVRMQHKEFSLYE